MNDNYNFFTFRLLQTAYVYSLNMQAPNSYRSEGRPKLLSYLQVEKPRLSCNLVWCLDVGVVSEARLRKKAI